MRLRPLRPAAEGRRCVREVATARRWGGGVALEHRVGPCLPGNLAARARKCLPTGLQEGHGPGGRGLRPLHLGNVG
jgi:hypothetical protein